MKKTILFWMMLVPTLLVLVACSDNESTTIFIPDTPQAPIDVVGTWYMDFSGQTTSKWTYGPVIRVLEFQNEGLANITFYYMLDNSVFAYERGSFAYSITKEGALTIRPTDTNEVVTLQCSITDDVLKMTYSDKETSFQRASLDMIQKFGQWDQQENKILVNDPVNLDEIYESGK